LRLCQDQKLMTIGSDGAVRGWNLETIDTADAVDDSGLFEIEPMNEIIIGRNVNLYSMVKSSIPETSIWFAQDSNGCIWKLDLSFSNITQDPECLFSFHAGAILGMDVSESSHLMATTALDSSVRVFDFLSKKELTICRFKQGGTTLTWASDMVNTAGGLLVVGFNDGVVRLLELYNTQSLHVVAGRTRSGDAELRLRQALKPHNAPVTAIAYERTRKIMATGSTDSTVFFFTVGERYTPIGFVTVPGPVQGLEWSPQSHEKNTLLIFCQNGHVVEVQCPDPGAQTDGNTFQLSDLPTMHFCFSSIKSRIKVIKEEKKKEREKRLKKLKEQKPDATEEELREEEKEEDEKEEELPPLYIPSPPSPLHCCFYSTPGSFWLSMGSPPLLTFLVITAFMELLPCIVFVNCIADTWGNFLSNVTINGQPEICYLFSMEELPKQHCSKKLHCVSSAYEMEDDAQFWGWGQCGKCVKYLNRIIFSKRIN
uniref:Uncharacterized protein n=1 Tax=Sinocyclocheilus grahami TaxID=75366 RepID=A0A672S872_SINGR